MAMFHEEERNTTSFLEAYEGEHRGEPLVLEFREGDSYKCQFDTAYESDNGLEVDDSGYDEFYELVYKVLEVIIPGPNCEKPECGLCINYRNFPVKVTTSEGAVIYRASCR